MGAVQTKALIGLHGQAQSGKDTLGSVIKLIYPEMELCRFASPLKIMLATFMNEVGIDSGIAEATFEDISWKERINPNIGKSPRDLLLSLGTEWARDMVHPDIWLIAAKQKLARSRIGIALTDVRFPNEAQWILARGGIVIETVRLGGGTIELDHKSANRLPDELITCRVKAEAGDVEGLERRGLEVINQYMKGESFAINYG